MNINLGSLYNKIYNCAFKIVLFFLHLKLKIFKKIKVKFILFFIISMFIQDIIATPINANTTDKIAYKGLKCDYSDENVKFENAFFIKFEKNEYKLIGLNNNKVVTLRKNFFLIEKNKQLNLNLFWGERNLYLNLKDLKFGNFKKGKCISFYDNNKLINSLLNCKKNTCDHN